jgi:anaerobic selenocysteine-containing dehydrogenase
MLAALSSRAATARLQPCSITSQLPCAVGDRVMHLAINSGSDLALFNAWLTYIAEKGWTDNAFVAASTKDLDKALAA